VVRGVVTPLEYAVAVAGSLAGVSVLFGAKLGVAWTTRTLRPCWRCRAVHRACDKCVPYDPI